ncbi:GGDEF domain-containing protein [Halalkalibacillus sediminis]|uniref:GGDEF domain-containing protein n=1 Tax=Halalkalibacillus sediminis TaxID=2018042 RepID=A0A2I0QV26_9BACI|nr:GGDEF domain-containing protein [Halalkalibacillus sediminis]
MILKELLSNFAILISAIFLYTQSTSSTPLTLTSPLRSKFIVGMLGGILSNILMLYSIEINQTFIDLRHIPVIMVTYYGGAIPAIITMTCIILGRFLIGFTMSAFFAFALIILITAATLLIIRLSLSKKKKIFLSITASNIIFAAFISYLLPNFDRLFVLIVSYWIISYFAGFVSFYTVEFVRRSHRLLYKYKSEAATDGLTGLHNVRRFDETFNVISTQAEEKGESLSLLYIDIDHFKKVNDTYGHKEGDQVLINLSKILKNTVRPYDIVSRNGGEEFTIILLDCPLKRASDLSEKIRSAVKNYSFELTTGQAISITVSIGVASYNETTERPSMLIEEADQALYRAKQTGRNKVSFSSKESEEYIKV